jgi:thiol-disulfide isomerase/thioredoxin
MTFKHSALALLLGLLASSVAAGGGDLPAKWWEKSKAHHVGNYKEYLDLVKGEAKDKVVFIDFFMKRCPWCFYCLEDFNTVIEEMTELYGEENIVFLAADGPVVKQMASLYNIQSYPSFIACAPGSEGMRFERYQGHRDYEGFKSWINAVMINQGFKAKGGSDDDGSDNLVSQRTTDSGRANKGKPIYSQI